MKAGRSASRIGRSWMRSPSSMAAEYTTASTGADVRQLLLKRVAVLGVPECVRELAARVEPAEVVDRTDAARGSRYRSGSVAEEYELDVAGRRLAVTSPDKVFFSERGATKLD